MPALFRLLILVPLGYAAACLAGAAFGATILFHDRTPDALEIIGYATATAVLIAWGSGLLLIVPAVIGTVIAELAGWRSWLFWVPFWALLALLLCLPGIGFLSGFFMDVGDIPPADGMSVQGATGSGMIGATAAAGTVAGFVYWLIAGRLTGTGWDPTSSGSGPASPQSRQAPSRTDSLPPASPSASA